MKPAALKNARFAAPGQETARTNAKPAGFCGRLTLLYYILFICSGSLANLAAQEDEAIALGGENRWEAAEYRSGLTELRAVRPWPVLALAGRSQDEAARNLPYGPQARDPEGPELILSFDEDSPEFFTDRGGRYAVTAVSGGGGTFLSSAGPEWARLGTGAAFFSAAAGPRPQSDTGLQGEAAIRPQPGPLVITPRIQEAIFAPGRNLRDFSLEFWLYPLNVENGEQIVNWSASRSRVQGGYYFQHIRCSVVKNRLTWHFGNFFTAPGEEETRNTALNGTSTVVPKLWSHHLIRFDADTGLLEYLVNGSTEAIAYMTDSGAEGGDVYTPIIGQGGEFVLGKGYTGLLDEFRIHNRYAGEPGREFGVEGSLSKYPPQGGRMETRVFDLGPEAGAVLRLEAQGGRISLGGRSKLNDYAGGRTLSFADNSAIQFFMRIGDNPYRWTEADWQAVEAGMALSPAFQGRYLQIAADLYPSADGETSPYLEELRILYRPNEIPQPPARISAVAQDGAVELSWRSPLGDRPDGYLVYYGTSRGEYFGAGALQGPSPVNVGRRTSLRLEGLDNGTLYYFTVASYKIRPGSEGPSREQAFLVGEFSREVTARPLLAYTFRRNE
jgi:hypothetical protein